MTEGRRVVSLICIMAVVSLIVTGVTITMLYRVAFNEVKARLVEAAQSQARMIEAISRFNVAHQKKWHHPPMGDPEEATLSQIIDAHQHFTGFDETGEFTLARKEGNNIVFLLSHRHYDLTKPKPVPLDSDLAEPMRRALLGKSGTLVGLDYRGQTVLAAYEPVGELNLGIVAKIDLDEIRSPFIKAGLISALVAALAVLLGAALFIQVTNPMIRRLAESEERFRLLVEDVTDYAIFMIDPMGRVVSWNLGAERIKGYREEEIIGRNFSCFYPHEDIEDGKPERALEIAAAEGRCAVEGLRVRKDGSRFWASVFITALRDKSGRLRGFSKVTRDITDHKLAEEQIKASLEEKKVLLREIHHRVKNNMQVIISLLRLQAEQIGEKRYSDMLKESQDRIKTMALIHERLYQAKDFANVNFDEYVESIVKGLFRSHGVNTEQIILRIKVQDVSLDLENAIPCGLIINELVSNSLKHAFPQGRKGEIRISLRSIGMEEIELILGDDGVGIPEDLDIEKTDSLGLHLVSILVEHQLGGEIDLNREGGTEYRILFRRGTDKGRTQNNDKSAHFDSGR